MSTSFPDELADLEDEIFERLSAIDARLIAEVKSDYSLADVTVRHLIEAGGKRFRPMMVLLTAMLGDVDAPGVVPAAVVVELTHLATLYHDDVMDEAPVRRGVESANSRWGNTVAILSGDFLLARASALLADLGPEFVRIQAHTFERLALGQMRETMGPAEGEDAIAHHLEVLAGKTGSLIAAAGRYGAMTAGLTQEETEQIANFGEAIGIAFQLSDDLLDIASDNSGKTPGTDLREGIKTLPVLLALRDPSTSPRLAQLLNKPLTDDAEHAEALAALRVHPAMREARKTLDEWIDRAMDGLAALPDGDVKLAFKAMCDGLVDRAI
jgi:heptaprenyl diphosphate synthase